MRTTDHGIGGVVVGSDSLEDYSPDFCSSLGEVFVGLCVTAGVRQGCPLSGILFATATNVLIYALRTIHKISAPHMSKAYADDIGGVIKDLPTDLPRIINIFEEFASS